MCLITNRERDCQKVQCSGRWRWALGSWICRKGTGCKFLTLWTRHHCLLYDTFLTECQDAIISAPSLFHSAVLSASYLSGRSSQMSLKVSGCISLIYLGTYVESDICFFCRISSAEMSSNILFASVIIFPFLWPWIILLQPYTVDYLGFTHSSYYFTPPYLCMCCTLYLEFLFLRATDIEKKLMVAKGGKGGDG